MSTTSPANEAATAAATHQTAETRFVDAGGVRFAFRRFGVPAPARRAGPSA